MSLPREVAVTFQTSIRFRLVLTTGLIMLLSAACMGVYSYLNQSRQLQNRFRNLAENETRLFNTILQADGKGLSRALEGLSRLESLLKPLAAKDRTALLAVAQPIFDDLKIRHNITHMYFITPDGRVLLRAHRPGQYGDLLKRATYLRAAATRATASGLEMGRNFFSLRCVTPVYLQGEIIGYLEMAEEIDHVFAQMKNITGNDVSLFLPKKYIEQYDVALPFVQTGDFTLLYPTRPQRTLELAKKLDDFLEEALHRDSVAPVKLGKERFMVAAGPFLDAFGHTAGLLFAQRNITPHHTELLHGVATSIAVFLAILIIGNALLYLSLKKSLTLFQTLRRHIQNLTRTWQADTPLAVTTHDEIGDLAADLNRMQARIGELQCDLENRADQLAATNQELEAFSISLSHDLRLPLTRVYSAAQMLRDEYSDRLDETGRFLVENICAANEGMEELIEAILTLAQISRREMVRQTVDLAELSRDVAAELELAVPERDVAFECPTELIARGDAQLLRVALKNLLENAWKYTGSVDRPEVTVGMQEKEGKRVYFVRDNGIGFDMKDADQLFVPFKRLHNSKDFPGTGIGLSTVQRIIQRHRGTVWARSAKGEGATFYFTLP